MLKSKEIIRDIIEDITLEKYKVDERMPSESQLAIKYNCNRHTVRKVTESLIERGYLRRIHGGPTYINGLPSNHILNFSSLLELYGESSITSKDIPDLDLYMDQIMTLFDSHLANNKKNEDDKLLTKTMINT